MAPATEERPTYRILDLEEKSFYSALSNDYCTPSQLEQHKRARYLFGYLTDINARTLVVEYDYTDGDYLDDFAAYYVKCFPHYRRRCKRVHFFSTRISDEQFRKLVLGSIPDDKREELTESYLGFVVARPLPEAIIGRTVLKTYPDDGGRRNYKCTRQYSVNLFGLALTVESLPFQEQDTVLAACATVSLWSSFQKTAELFGTPGPRPAAITESANQFVRKSRAFPSRGLIVEQICNAVRSVGLEPEVIPVSGAIPLASLMRAYLQSGLPVILGVQVDGIGLHAMTVAGYSIKGTRHLKEEVRAPFDAIPMTGLRIDEFLAHDDQIGPFARIRVGAATAKDPHSLSPIEFEGS
jgi:hypothetical protein